MAVPPDVRSGAPRAPEAAFAELGRILTEPRPLAAALDRVAQLACETLAGAAAAGVTLVGPGRSAVFGRTGELAAELDRWQHEAGAGPGVAAALRGGTVAVPDTAREERYRDFAGAARERGVTGVLAVGLPLGRAVRGALTVYRVQAGWFDAAAEDLARAFAGCTAAQLGATAAARSAETARQVRTAMESRAVIEQAKGVLMERHRCSPEDAFRMLAAESQRTNRKLRGLAAELVAALRDGAGAEAHRDRPIRARSAPAAPVRPG